MFIKSPCLSQFLCHNQPQTFVLIITSGQLFRSLSFRQNWESWSINYLNFKVNYFNMLYLKQKWSDCHETKKTLNISMEYWASNVAINCDLGNDIEFSRSNIQFAISLGKMIRLHDGTESLPEPMLHYHQQCPVTFIWGQLRYLSHQSLKLTWNLLI